MNNDKDKGKNDKNGYIDSVHYMIGQYLGTNCSMILVDSKSLQVTYWTRYNNVIKPW